MKNRYIGRKEWGPGGILGEQYRYIPDKYCPCGAGISFGFTYCLECRTRREANKVQLVETDSLVEVTNIELNKLVKLGWIKMVAEIELFGYTNDSNIAKLCKLLHKRTRLFYLGGYFTDGKRTPWLVVKPYESCEYRREMMLPDTIKHYLSPKITLKQVLERINKMNLVEFKQDLDDYKKSWHDWNNGTRLIKNYLERSAQMTLNIKSQITNEYTQLVAIGISDGIINDIFSDKIKVEELLPEIIQTYIKNE